MAEKPESASEEVFLPQFLQPNYQSEDCTEEQTRNGLCLNDVYVPQEIIFDILSLIDPTEVLQYSLVCHKWNRLIKSNALWSTLYRHKYRKRPRELPWYIFYCHLTTNYFDTNWLRNGNGQEQFNHWEFVENGGEKCRIEDPPNGANRLSCRRIPEFYNHTSCFATSYETCYKMQRINLGKNRLFRYILNTYKPYIVVSEWTAGRLGCGSIYKLRCRFERQGLNPCVMRRIDQWEGRKWKKVEIRIKQYPENIQELIFENEGCAIQSLNHRSGHNGSKMAGGVLRILFHTIKALPLDENGREIPKVFSKFKYVTNIKKKTDEDEEEDNECSDRQYHSFVSDTDEGGLSPVWGYASDDEAD